MDNIGFSPYLPLRTDNIHYDMIFDITVNIHQNLKNLLLTNPGERIMIPEFGVGIRKLLFEMNTEDVFSDLSETIQEQVNSFLPYIEIDDIFQLEPEDPETADESLSIVIQYSVPSLGIESAIKVDSQ